LADLMPCCSCRCKGTSGGVVQQTKSRMGGAPLTIEPAPLPRSPDRLLSTPAPCRARAPASKELPSGVDNEQSFKSKRLIVFLSHRCALAHEPCRSVLALFPRCELV